MMSSTVCTSAGKPHSPVLVGQSRNLPSHRNSIVSLSPKTAFAGILSVDNRGRRKRPHPTAGSARSVWIGGNGIADNVTNARTGLASLVKGAVVSAIRIKARMRQNWGSFVVVRSRRCVQPCIRPLLQERSVNDE